MAADPDRTDPGPPSFEELRGTLNLFGFPPGPALVRVRPRSPAWRGIRAAFFLGGGVILAPLVGMIPPHAPWVAGVLGFGGWMGVRKWREHFTVQSLLGNCPRCNEPLEVGAGIPLRQGMSVPCSRCHHEVRLTVLLASASSAADAPTGPGSTYPGPPDPMPGTGGEG